MRTLIKVYLFLLLFFPLLLSAGGDSPDSICGRKVLYDQSGRVLGWYMPEVPGAVYDRVVKLSAGFLLHAPVEPKTGLPMYLVTCCFKGPDMTPDKNFIARDWMHNPACFFAGAVQSLAVQYYAYSGDSRYIMLVKKMLDYQLDHGTTPTGFSWPFVPYASSDPFATEYQGATRWNGKRGDGLYCIEPDKAGELGYAYLRFYEITEDKKYLDAAIRCADALAKNVRGIRAAESDEENYEVPAGKSPWPFRVNACTGDMIDEYCSNVLEPVKRLKELIRIGDRIGLSDERKALYRQSAGTAWNWLFDKNGPLRTFIWNGYFEDVEHDPTLSNRVQVTPVELAKYLAENPVSDKMFDIHVPALLYYAVSAFKTQGMDAMNEQLWCYRPMGSHTARFGSACALWYENSGNKWFRDQAFQYLNMAAYMTHDNGVVSTGPDYPATWFSDGYSDYIRHFLDALAAVPEWAPAGENHLLRSSSVVQSIYYQDHKIEYVTFDQKSTEKFSLMKKPSEVLAGTKELKEVSDPNDEGWRWMKLEKGGVLIICREQGNSVTIGWNP
jgi:hypothetical protein